MAAILNVPVTTAVTAALSSVFQLRPGPGGQALPTGVLLQGNFTYGSGGTTATAWVQTSIDGGSTWCDIARFAFTTASARFVYNVNSSTSVTAEATPTDGTLATNTANDGILGNLFRVKYTTTGTYAATTLRVDMISDGVTAQ